MPTYDTSVCPLGNVPRLPRHNIGAASEMIAEDVTHLQTIRTISSDISIPQQDRH